MRVVIKNGTIVTDVDSYPGDILIEGERIARIGPDIAAELARDPGPGPVEVIDAAGKLVLPGGVDPHTHLDLPMFDTVSSDDHYTGHKAAAFGGTTTVMDFVPMQDAGSAEDSRGVFARSVEAWRARSQKAAIDYSFHMNLTRFDDTIAGEIPSLLDLGITTLKVFTAYNGRLRLDDGSIFRALQIAREHAMLVMPTARTET
jgi:dihydropyrimidinase